MIFGFGADDAIILATLDMVSLALVRVQAVITELYILGLN
jgi:hypothetical protein